MFLSEHNISYEGYNILEEQPVPDEYDEDQGARILRHCESQTTSP